MSESESDSGYETSDHADDLGDDPDAGLSVEELKAKYGAPASEDKSAPSTTSMEDESDGDDSNDDNDDDSEDDDDDGSDEEDDIADLNDDPDAGLSVEELKAKYAAMDNKEQPTSEVSTESTSSKRKLAVVESESESEEEVVTKKSKKSNKKRKIVEEDDDEEDDIDFEEDADETKRDAEELLNDPDANLTKEELIAKYSSMDNGNQDEKKKKKDDDFNVDETNKNENDDDDDVDFSEDEAETKKEVEETLNDPDANLTAEELRAKYAAPAPAEEKKKKKLKKKMTIQEEITPALSSILDTYNGAYAGVTLRDVLKSLTDEYDFEKAAVKKQKPFIVDFISQRIQSETPADATEAAEEAYVTEQQSKKKKRKKKDIDDDDDYNSATAQKGPRRGISGYFFYLEDRRPVLKEQGITGRDAVKQLSDEWNQLDAEKKAPYLEKQKDDQARYIREMEELKENDYAAYEAIIQARKRKPASTSSSNSGDKESRPATTKKARAPKEEVPDSELSAIDLAMRTLQRGRKKVRVEDEMEAVTNNNEMAQFFVKKMELAYETDNESREKGQPAVQKIRMLREVESQCSKVQQQERLLDYHLLPVLNKWLQPVYDTVTKKTTLPNIKLRETLYRVLSFLPINETRLESAQGIGRTLNALQSHPSETTKNKKMVREMLQKWVRSVTNRNKMDYRALAAHEYENRSQIAERKEKIPNRPYRPLEKSKRAAIPVKETFDFAIRPASKVIGDEVIAMQKAQNNSNAILFHKLQNSKKTKKLTAKSVDNSGKSILYK